MIKREDLRENLSHRMNSQKIQKLRMPIIPSEEDGEEEESEKD